ncbi:hypothetical protein KIN20_009720 [Parelaphostrongylus tenuis]|uniref:Protein kinase domain-containing protein n=1 Tax=Parelaphostrongylus tenuis TaxID=148309 RepID=A0AAD5MQY4_PARTN|nr:hypothetical protein KIN20_009720 [Parelaphostrongylus tenuis]
MSSSSSFEDASSDLCVSYTYDPNNNTNILREEHDDVLDDEINEVLSLEFLNNLSTASTQSSESSSSYNNITRQDLEIIRTIGTGTFGKVALVKDRRTEEHFALKIINIHEVVKTCQVGHVHNEKRVLHQLEHPFIVKLIATDRDHVYRDLKPQNLMLSRDGHIKMVDFGFAKEIADRTYTVCGTPEYLAPECISFEGYNQSADWWSFGILIYEMLVGRAPFRGFLGNSIYDSIMRYNLQFPRNVHSAAKDLIKKLLTLTPSVRIGCATNGVNDILRHKWFRKINWDDIRHSES